MKHYLAVHLMPEVRKALRKRGYVLIIIGGGITGDCQINVRVHHMFSRILSLQTFFTVYFFSLFYEVEFFD